MDLPFYALRKPISNKEVLQKIMEKIDPLPVKEVVQVLNSIDSPKYLYWIDMRHIGLPKYGITGDELWPLVRRLRDLRAIKAPIMAEGGDYFQWSRTPNTDQYLHRIDMHSGGSFLPRQAENSEGRSLMLRGIIDEAIASSQLEGAHTTYAAAKKMILEKRKPQNESEQMILNNYRTILAIDEDYKNRNLNLDTLIELHTRLAEKTKAASGRGRLRLDEDEIRVHGPIGDQQYVTHIPPKQNFLQREILRLIDYANDQGGDEFLHPIIKAIFIHFWVAYLHPFTDGNGRLARALFYWYLLRKGYWMMMYLPISSVIKKAPGQYAMAYIFSEQDSLDLTYFYDFHIRKIIQALDEFEEYFRRKGLEKNRLDAVLEQFSISNPRQKRLLYHLITHHSAGTNATVHGELHNVSRQTAAKDLHELEKKGLLISKREGQAIRYYASEKLKQLTI